VSDRFLSVDWRHIGPDSSLWRTADRAIWLISGTKRNSVLFQQIDAKSSDRTCGSADSGATSNAQAAGYGTQPGASASTDGSAGQNALFRVIHAGAGAQRDGHGQGGGGQGDLLRQSMS
jgi:hypothetical protein